MNATRNSTSLAASAIARCRALLRGQSGSSLVEVGLVFSFFCMPLLIGSAEMGLLVFDSIQVQNSARTGAEYAMQSVTLASDTSGITAAAQADAPTFGTALTVTPTVYYVCSSSITGTHYTSLSSATSACSGSTNHPLEFVQVTTTGSVTPTLRCPGFSRTFSVVGYSAMEVEQ